VLASGDLAERRAAYEILGRTETAEATAIVAAELVRLDAEQVPAELALDLVLAAETHGLDEALAARTERRADPVLAADLDALFGGDADRGRKVFERADLACVRCHDAGADEAVRVGPALAGVSGRLSRLQQLEAILDPNRNTARGWGGSVLFLEGGGAVSGRVIDEDEEAVRVLQTTGEIEEVPVAAIEERRADLSAMPEGLGEMLSRLELRDLLAYLASL